ncbi:MAG: TIM barrel protein [Vicinamibacterales bacterium]
MTGHSRVRRRRVGLDNYGLFPLDLSPIETLEWAAAHGADGVAFSGLTPTWQDRLDGPALADLRAFAAAHGLYLEWGGAQHIPRDMTSWARQDLAAVNRGAAQQAAALGTTVVRSCSGGLMRWDARNPPTDVLLRETAESLRAQRTMLQDCGVSLAIETHFEFTSFELLRLFEMCEAEPGGWLGICLDTMNVMTMIEHPVMASERLLPWVVSTHVKDGGVLGTPEGLLTFPAPAGEGIVDLAAIIRRLDALDRPVHLSVEDHGGSFLLPIHDEGFLVRFPDMTGAELNAILDLADATRAMPGCRPTDRADWPARCEARIAADLASVRQLAESVPATREVPS